MLLQRPRLWEIPQPAPAVYARLTHKAEQLQQRLRDIVARHATVKLASSLAVEDMVITDALAKWATQGLTQETMRTIRTMQPPG